MTSTKNTRRDRDLVCKATRGRQHLIFRRPSSHGRRIVVALKTRPPTVPPARGLRLTRRQALQVAGLGFGHLATHGCGPMLGPMPTRCVDGPMPPEPLVSGDDSLDARRASSRRLLSGVDHIVVVLMENRSFDHFLGGLCLDPDYAGAHKLDGLVGDEALPDISGRMVASNCLEGYGTLIPQHDWANSQLAYDNGLNDGFVRVNAGANQAEVMSYLGRQHLPFTHALAAQSTVCDRWFASFMGPTWPNRFYLHATNAQGRTKNHPIGLDAPTTIWDRMADRCLTAKNYMAGAIPWYSVAFPTKSFSGNDAMVPEPIDGFFRDALSGNLPQFSLIDPDFQVNDGHPPHDLGLAEAFLSSVHRALVNSPNWARTLFVVAFDEHGGFYDHVPPPAVGDPRPDFRRLGFRVPAIVAGPMVRQGAVVSTIFEHSSIAATLQARFGIESLGMRMDGANDLADCIDPARLQQVTSSSLVTLPTVELRGALMRGEVLHASSQPEMERLARAGGVPFAHVDTRAPLERVRSWMRHAQELEAVRVVG
jgi:phospholipase C